MTIQMSRRAFLALSATPALLAACSGATIESPLSPARFLSVGDGFSDLGQGGTRYTVNDGSVNIWTQQLVSSYGMTITARVNGGTSFAQGGALISALPGEAVPSVETQITTMLTDLSIGSLGSSDVVLVSGGLSDIVAQVKANGISDNTTSNIQAAGTALGALVRKLVNAGCNYVVVSGVYSMGLSPWAVSQGEQGGISSLAQAFNDALLLSVVDLGQKVFYVDTAYYINLLYSTPGSYGLTDVTTKACSTADASTCTASTISSSVSDYGKLMFADAVYFTPAVHRLIGSWAYTNVHNRW